MNSKKITVQARRELNDNIVTKFRMESENSHVLFVKTGLLFYRENPVLTRGES